MFTWEIMFSLFKNPNHVLFKDPVVIMKEIMSWLLKDLTVGWLNLTMASQTVKNGLKAKNITLPQFFILQNFKKILRADPELWLCAIFGSRMTRLFWTIFF